MTELWRSDIYGQWRGRCDLAAGEFTAREGEVYYSKLVKSMIVILGSIEKYLWQGAIRTAIMTGVLISRGNIQYCVVAEMLAVSEQIGRSGAAAGAHGSLPWSANAVCSNSVHGELLYREVMLLCCCSRTH